MKRFILCVVYVLTIFSHINVNAKQKPISNELSYCLFSRLCRNNVDLIKNIDDVIKEYPNSNFDSVADEFNKILADLNRLKVKVYLADKKYFPTTYYGIYNFDHNTIYLNKAYMTNNVLLIRTTRHEGWHVAQDCAKGLWNGSGRMLIAPKYAPASYFNIEYGAITARRKKGMTIAALKSCITNDDIHLKSYLNE